MRFAALALSALLVAGPDLSAAGATPSGADWYTVEVLVFRYTGPGTAQGETWPAHVAAPSTRGTVYPPAVATGPFAALAAASPAIAAARGRLSSASGYAPVLEMGWQQPRLPPSQAKPVTLAPPGTAPVPQTAGGAAQLEGRVTVVTANRKPNVSLRLRLCEAPPPGIQVQLPAAASAPASAAAATTITTPAPQTSLTAYSTVYSNAPPMQCFALRQRRFVTPDQLQYFDNPAFGALVLVRRISAPQ